MRARRAFGVLAVTAVLAASLTACRSQVGVAAFVGTTRITETQIQGYLLPELAPTPSAPAGTTAQQADPKQTVSSFLIQQAVYNQLLAGTTGGLPSNTELAALHDTALQVQFQASIAGDAADQQIASGLAASGLRPGFLGLFLQVIELRQAAINRFQAKSPTDLGAAFAKLNIPVRVNPRYGPWDSTQLTIAASTTPNWLDPATLVPNS